MDMSHPLVSTSSPRRTARACVAVVVAIGGTFLFSARARAEDGPDTVDFFEREVRSVLVEACVRCHGPEKQQGGLRLDSRGAILAGGDSGPALVPGQPDESLLIAVIRRRGELKMPPKAPLSERQVAALTRWVELKAPWGEDRKGTDSGPPSARPTRADHWAFRPLSDPAPPAVLGDDWARTPLDRFILARLEAEGVSPSPPADRRTLIRRATYDLTGLPPSPEDVERFVRDDAPDAYPRLVDRLLASPRYGEHWGRHWLDVARYSDTKGYVYAREERFWVHAWAYRDWVVRALNADMPYDRFLLLQLAADRVAADDPASQAAMGFLTLGRRYLGVTHDIIDDRIDVVTRGLLGLTVACARCHDHKFDPIPTEDYYALYGVFRSSSERQVLAAKSIGTGPEAEAFGRGLLERVKKLDEGIAAKRRETAARARARVAAYLLAQRELAK
jgi:cytochrome c553